MGHAATNIFFEEAFGDSSILVVFVDVVVVAVFVVVEYRPFALALSVIRAAQRSVSSAYRQKSGWLCDRKKSSPCLPTTLH